MKIFRRTKAVLRHSQIAPWLLLFLVAHLIASDFEISSLLTQILPFMIVTALFASYFRNRAATFPAVQWGAIALLFGNTAALTMGMPSGTCFAAVCVLAFMYCQIRSRPELAGFFLSLAILGDRGAWLLLPALVIALAISHSKFRVKPSLRFMAGMLPSAIGWWAFQMTLSNPWEAVLALPRGAVFSQLLVGSSRGLLWTQPWILAILLVPLGRYYRRHHVTSSQTWLYAFLTTSFGFLLLRNAGLEPWDGPVSGPLHLGLLLPSFGILVMSLWDRIPKVSRSVVKASIAFSVLFFFLALATSPLVGREELWSWYLTQTLVTPSSTTIARLLFLVVAASLLVRITLRSKRKSRLVTRFRFE